MLKRREVISLLRMGLVLVLLIACLTGCGKQEKTGAGSSVEKNRTVVDMAGRTIAVPGKIDKIFSVSPVGTILVYTLDPDKLAGWNYELSLQDKKFILPKYQGLPNLGGWYAKNTGNTEEILKIHPDVFISMGAIDETAVSLAERLQKQLGIPVLLVDGQLTKLNRAYEFIGDLIGKKDRAQMLADYCQKTVDDIMEKAKLISPEKQVKVYYAEGSNGLETDPKGSRHTEVLDYVGGVNVAEVTMKGGMGLTPVSLEQVLAWNPDLILSWHEEQGGAYKTILSDPKWRGIKAVKNDRVFEIPDEPFNWFDRPPSVNRIIGVKWLANLLYPDTFKGNIEAEVKDYYARFYHYNLSEQDITALLEGSIAKSD